MKAFAHIWKEQTLWLFPQQMLQHRQESLLNMQKQFPALELIAGVVEGNYNDQAGIQALSQVPSREELLGKLLGSIQSPITNFARVLNQIAEAQGGADTEAAAE